MSNIVVVTRESSQVLIFINVAYYNEMKSKFDFTCPILAVVTRESSQVWIFINDGYYTYTVREIEPPQLIVFTVTHKHANI